MHEQTSPDCMTVLAAVNWSIYHFKKGDSHLKGTNTYGSV